MEKKHSLKSNAGVGGTKNWKGDSVKIPRGTTRYTYDCFNRTESVRSANGGYIRNRYDAEGLRFELHENGKVSRFIFSGSEVVTEVDADYGLKAAII